MVEDEAMSTPEGHNSGRELDFRPRARMTRWFEPVAMFRLLLRIWSTRRMADQREQPTDQPTKVFDYAQHDDEFWFDYVADLGDAFDPTMCVAWHLGRSELHRSAIDPRLAVHPEYGVPDFLPGLPMDDIPPVLPRGRLLVMGGDLVYPSGSHARYRNQTIGPYRLAWERGKTDGTDDEAGLLALPANHDWYGGIGPFRKAFCGDTKIGGWRTNQGASWWAARLPNDWWIWGVDTALDGTVNPAQYDYFRSVRDEMPREARVIVATPVPIWRLRERYVDRLDTLSRFFLGLGVEPEVYLSGDYHIAALHRRERHDGEPEWHLTSGGGGAFQHPVHNLDRSIPNQHGGLPEPAVADDEPLRLLATWPSNTESRLGTGGWWHLLFDRAAVSLLATLAVLQLPIMGLAGVAAQGPADNRRSIAETAVDQFLPVGLLTTAGLIALATFVLARASSSARGAVSWARSVGAGHGVAQSVVFVGAALAANLIARRTDGSGLAVATVMVVSALVAAVASVVVVGTYLRFANRQFRMHDNESYSARHSGDNRHFTRFRISADGSLSCYLIAFRDTGHGWAEAFRSGTDLPPPSASEPELIDVRFRTGPSERFRDDQPTGITTDA